MILIYSNKITTRLVYVLDFIFIHNLNINYKIITNECDFNLFNGIKINYDRVPKKNCLNIIPENILFEDNITEFTPNYVKDNFWKIILFNYTKEQEIPFDIFASVFWLISRYEEYNYTNYDEHGRFKYINSLLYKANVLNVPLVDIWLNNLKKIIELKFNVKIENNKKFKFISTLDIDNLYAFKGKNFIRIIGTCFKYFYKDKINFFKEYLKYLKSKKDPFDLYNEILNLHYTVKIVPIFFVLTITKKTKYDRNITCTNKYFIEKIKEIAEKAEIALHSSYYSCKDNKLISEKESIENIIKTKVTKNRFHYLKFKLPDSYEELIQCGINEDFSMGYSNIDGFRAGTCTPFYFFNLKKNKPSSLLVHPFVFMDRFLINYFNKEERIFSLANYYLNCTKKYNGEFVLLWHNQTLNTIKNINYFNTYKNILLNAYKFS
ncbi:MAG: polysaccharide deacetylase family protein [Bacteroidales bacterium]|nr:polysaccharide deacetylase family protein [Bacteroidales bacterium]